MAKRMLWLGDVGRRTGIRMNLCAMYEYINTPAVSDPWSEPPNSASDAAAYEL